MFNEIMYPRQTVLVSAAAGGKSNVTAVDFAMPVCEKPPIVAVALHSGSLTLDLICSSMEFVVAIPTEKLKEAVLLCGTTSGKYIDKFEEAALTQVKAKNVSAPLVLEAAANLECRVLSYSSAGGYTIIIGEVVESHLPKDEKIEEPLLFNKGGKKLFGLKLD